MFAPQPTTKPSTLTAHVWTLPVLTEVNSPSGGVAQIMPSDYEQVSRENETRYVPEVVRLMAMILDQYADPAHFVFELLQNAEDALHRRAQTGGSRSVRFEVANDCVRLSHYGLPFTKQDVRAICGIAEGTKEGEPMAIGHFGVGFKSVNKVTERPEIHSGEEHFAIRDYFLPFAIPPIALNEGETVIALPFQEGDAEGNVVGQLKRLGGERTLLFLRKINEIEWHVQGGPSGFCQREEVSESESVRRVSLLSESTGQDPLEELWLVFSKAVSSEGKLVGHVELAFKLALDNSGKDVVEGVDDSPLVAFFPTVLQTRLGMLVQGPYRTTPSRDNIPQNDPWNRYLVEETAALLVDALRYLRDRRALRVRVFDAIPLSRSRFHDDDNRFAPMFDAVRDAIARERLLPAHRGGYVPATQAWLAPEQGLRNLISRGQLAELVGADKPVAWLAGDITKRRTPALYDYLTEEHDVEEIDTEGLLWRLDEEFLAGQDDKWIRRLYEFLNRQRRQHDSLNDRRSELPLIRLEDGAHVALHDEHVAFLPTEGRSSPRDTVRLAVCDSKPALEFLKWLGLSEFDRIDAIIRDVIPMYRKKGKIDESRYVDDLREIVDAYHAASADRKRLLTDALRNAYFVRAVDVGTGELSFQRPGDVYLSTKQLRALFDGVPSVLFPNRPPRGLRGQDIEALLEACGASRTLAVDQFDDLSRLRPGDRRRLRGKDGPRQGRAKRERLSDSKFRGLELLLESLSSLPAEEARDRAGLLWEVLREGVRRPGRPGFRATYSWFHYTPRVVEVDSASALLLNEKAWVPEGSGQLNQPGHVEFASLGWPAHDFLQAIIRFKRPEPPSAVAVIARRVGLDGDVLDAVIEEGKGLSANDVREALRSKRTSRAGGGVESVGSGATRRRPAPLRIQVETESEMTTAAQAEHDRKMDLEEAAITLIREREPTLNRTPKNNPGYDLYETNADGAAVRWIEVKAIAGDWDSRPVTLTHTQFDCAREKGDAYWLYVVEHAGTDHSGIVKINDPAGWESSYAFDKGWRVVSIPADATAVDPA